MNFNNLNGFFKNVNGYSFYPNEIRINLAANLGRSSLTHSYGYGLRRIVRDCCLFAVRRNSASLRLTPAGPRLRASKIAPGDFVPDFP